MSQRRTIPDMDALERRFVFQHLPSNHCSLLGARKRDNQIQLCAGIDHPADAAKNSIHFSKSAKSIDINRLQVRSLHKQFFVCHELPPYWSRVYVNTTVQYMTQQNRSSDTFVSTDAACAVFASVPHHRVHSEASWRLT